MQKGEVSKLVNFFYGRRNQCGKNEGAMKHMKDKIARMPDDINAI